MTCSVCKAIVPTMRCSGCKVPVCRGCKVNSNLDSVGGCGLPFAAFCSEDCRDGQEVRDALVSVPCPKCHGRPLELPKPKEAWMSRCFTCSDTGVVFPAAEAKREGYKALDDLRQRYPCGVCGGSWQGNTTTCQDCSGTGTDSAIYARVVGILKAEGRI